MGALGISLFLVKNRIKPIVIATRTIGTTIIRAINPELNFPEDFGKNLLIFVSVSSDVIWLSAPFSKLINNNLSLSYNIELSNSYLIFGFNLQFKV